MSASQARTGEPVNTPRQVLFASLVGTTIEFFDFYIYATAAVLVFPKLFFPAGDPATATLASLATFGIAFLARPIGSVLFGHFGDRIGRKTTLVVALATMGVSTVAIGVLPTYASIGLAAPLLLALCRFGQGLGLGGEWGGAVLLAIENAPAHKRAWYGMFPQLGAPVGFFLSGGVFLILSRFLTDRQFYVYGWRLPFLASSVLVFLGLWVRLTITETPVFRAAQARGEQETMPEKFLLMQLFATLFFAVTVPISAKLAEHGRRRTMLWITTAIGLFGLVLGPMFQAGTVSAIATMALGLSLMGLTYGPLGTVVSELFPTPVRYSGSSLAFNFAGIFGASLAPYIATWLARNYGLQYVGYYLTGSAVLTFVGLLMIRETKDDDLLARGS